MSKIILMVDDDVDDRELFLEALEEISTDIKCYMAADGKKALASLNEIPVPDIIFMDVNMPIMDGWSCLQQLKQQESLKDIPVIMYSTSSHTENFERAKSSGALCFFTKPYDYKGLKKCLETVVEHLIAGSLFSLSKEAFVFIFLFALFIY